MHRIRFAMADDHSTPEPLTGTVEIDETYVGGKPRYKGRHNRQKCGHGTRKMDDGERTILVIKKAIGKRLSIPRTNKSLKNSCFYAIYVHADDEKGAGWGTRTPTSKVTNFQD